VPSSPATLDCKSAILACIVSRRPTSSGGTAVAAESALSSFDINGDFVARYD
jgi:hypothetical protein